MPTAYHRIAGGSLERLAALSDGIFAVVMTLLVLDLHVPVREGLHSEAALWQGLGRLARQMLTYVLIFLTLGIFQVGQQTHSDQLTRPSRPGSAPWTASDRRRGVGWPRQGEIEDAEVRPL